MKEGCITPYCKRKPRNGRKCYTCQSRDKRARNPVRYAYDTLKANSKRRGKVFKLTFEEFKKFCRKTEYLAGKGRSRDCYTIDRIDNNKGYTIDNIRVLTNAENAMKGKKVLMYDWETKYAIVI